MHVGGFGLICGSGQRGESDSPAAPLRERASAVVALVDLVGFQQVSLVEMVRRRRQRQETSSKKKKMQRFVCLLCFVYCVKVSVMLLL